MINFYYLFSSYFFKIKFNHLCHLYHYHLAFALKCWHCDSSRHPSCGYPFEEKTLNKTLLAECVGAEAVCLKAICKCYYMVLQNRENKKISILISKFYE